MAVRIRVYPQAGSVGAQRNQIAKKNQQIVALRQQVALLRQQLAAYSGAAAIQQQAYVPQVQTGGYLPGAVQGRWSTPLGSQAGYGALATLQPEVSLGRIFAEYRGVFIACSLAWGIVFEGFRPDRWDMVGAGICLLGMAVIMFGPRG